MTSTGKGGAMDQAWPSLPLQEWQDTYATLHMWTQIVGKIRLALAPRLNHWWNVALYVTARGLTTSAMHHEGRTFQIDFDFLNHELVAVNSDRATGRLPLKPMPVAKFYRDAMAMLEGIGLTVKIWPVPVEVQNPVPFPQDYGNASYDPEYVARFRHLLTQADRVLNDFRSRFTGKCSPVHFFWGSFDLAVTRFSGRRAPDRPDADPITREAYSHEVISHGFWPGVRPSGPVDRGGSDSTVYAPAFYSYTAPEPPGLSDREILPTAAAYNSTMKEFIFLYDDMRKADSPDDALMDFLQTTYEAGANLAGWDRAGLERQKL
jgi:hypothetical protein